MVRKSCGRPRSSTVGAFSQSIQPSSWWWDAATRDGPAPSRHDSAKTPARRAWSGWAIDRTPCPTRRMIIVMEYMTWARVFGPDFGGGDALVLRDGGIGTARRSRGFGRRGEGR